MSIELSTNPSARGSVRSNRLSYELRDPPTRDRALAEIADGIRAKDGNLVHAARHIGVSHRMLLKWVAAFPELRSSVDEARAVED